MRSARMWAVGFGLVAIAVLPSRTADAQSTVVPIAPATRSCQLTGEYDARTQSGWNECDINTATCVQAGNHTETQAGLRGADLGSSFADDAGTVWMLFGDTWPKNGAVSTPWGPGGNPCGSAFATWTNPPEFTDPRVSSSDSWGHAQVTTAAQLCTDLALFRDETGDKQYQSFTILSGGGVPPMEVPLAGYEVPAGGFIANGKRYVFFTTVDAMGGLIFGAETFPSICNGFTGSSCPHNENNSYHACPGGRTVLAWQPQQPLLGDESSFTPLYFTSDYDPALVPGELRAGETPYSPGTGTFLNVAPVLGWELSATEQADIDSLTNMTPSQGLPTGFTASTTLFLFASSNFARLSDVYLAIVPANQVDVPNLTPGGTGGANWQYFSGLNAQGAPTWDFDVHHAQGLTGSLTAGELSVRYVQAAGGTSGSWLMLEAGQPPILSLTIASRSAPLPWGPWTGPATPYDVSQGYTDFIHLCRQVDPVTGACADSPPADQLANPGPFTGLTGIVYAPYLVPSSLFASVDATRTTVSFAMSTLNPYESDLMQMQVGLDTDGDTIPDYSDNCPKARNTDQQDSNFIAEQAATIATGDCHGTGCYLGGPSSLSPQPNSLGIAVEGRPPLPGDDSRYSPYWQTWYPGDACDTNATTGLTTGYGVAGIEVHLDGYIGNATGTASNSLPAHSTSGVTFCRCDDATSQDATKRARCLGSLAGQPDCIVAKDLAYPLLPPSLRVQSGWKTITISGGSGAGEYPMTHLERSDTTIMNGTYSPPPVQGGWNWPNDLTEFGLASNAPTMTGSLWGHVRNDSIDAFQAGTGESPPQPDTANNYIPTYLVQSVPIFGGSLGCAGDAPSLNELNGNPPPGSPLWGCISRVPGGPIWVQRPGPFGPIFGEEVLPGARSLLDLVASGAAQVVVGDDVAAGVPFGFTGTPALVVQTGNTSILGGLQLQDGQIGAVGGPPSISAGPDPPTLRSYAALDGNLWGLTTLNGAATLARQNVRSALAGGEPSVLAVDVVGATPVNAQAMAWSHADGNLWALDVVPGEHGKSDVRFVRVDVLGGAVETWRLREDDRIPDVMFLSASAQGEILIALSIHDHSEVALLDAHGQAHWSAKIHGTLFSTPVATSAGIGMPMSRPSPAPGQTTLDVRFIERHDLARGLCGAPWLWEHAQEAGAAALRGGDGHRDRDRDRGRDCGGDER